MYVTYLDIPPIPDNLVISNIEELNNLKSPYPSEYLEKYGDVYVPFFDINENLSKFLSPYIPFIGGNYIPYHRVGTKLPIHTDLPPRVKCYNYIIDPGGDEVYTNFYSEDHTQLLYREVIPIKTWHMLDVSIPHNTTGQTRFRFGLSISVPTDI